MLRLTQQSWIWCVSVGVARICEWVLLLFLVLLFAAIGTLLRNHAIGTFYFGVYAMLAVTLLAAMCYTINDWCRSGRAKRAASGNEPEGLNSV